MAIRRCIQSIGLLLIMLSTWTSAMADELSLLANIVSSEHRSEINRERDRFRYPQQTLEFFQIQSNMAVVEIWPGKGWYTEILAPWLKQGEGQLIAAGFPLNAGPQWRQTMQAEYQQWLQASPEFYDQVTVVELGPPSFWQLGADESVDAVLTFRNVHNWLKGGYEADMFNAFYQVLKPGGILGVTDHRSDPDTDIELMKKFGYLGQDLVIELAKQAGFEFEASSEINANPRDNKHHPKGVWTLPPTLRLGEENKQHYLAIGESDRMTLRFRKPLSITSDWAVNN